MFYNVRRTDVGWHFGPALPGDLNTVCSRPRRPG
jgi:hypothetical protein